MGKTCNILWFAKGTIGLALFAVPVILYNNCSASKGAVFSSSKSNSEVTISGNPFHSDGATNVLNNICTVLVGCNPSLSFSDCNTGLLTETSLASILGVPANTYATYSDLVAAEQNGFVLASSSALPNCTSDLSKLKCQDSFVQGAYSAAANSPDPFSGVVSLLSQDTLVASCQNVFSPSPGLFGSVVTYPLLAPPLGLAVGDFSGLGESSLAISLYNSAHSSQVAVFNSDHQGNFTPGIDMDFTGAPCANIEIENLLSLGKLSHGADELVTAVMDFTYNCPASLFRDSGNGLKYVSNFGPRMEPSGPDSLVGGNRNDVTVADMIFSNLETCDPATNSGCPALVRIPHIFSFVPSGTDYTQNLEYDFGGGSIATGDFDEDGKLDVVGVDY